MTKPHPTIEEKIASVAPEALSEAEQNAVWNAVSSRIASGQSVPSPFIPFVFTSKTMIPIALMIALLFGAGGTVAASDSARPGDILFPLDRAIEDFRLSLADEDGKNKLRIKFADERLREFDEIADDSSDDEVSGELTEAEANIFTNETVVKLEIGDRKVTFTTDADTREDIIAVIVARYKFSEEEVDAALTIDTEDRESDDDDRDEDEDRNERLENALDVLGDFIERNREAASSSPDVLNALATIESRILDRATFFPKEVRAKVDGDRARYEVRGSNGERVRVEIKDGEVRIKTKGGDDDDDRDDDRDDRDDEGLEVEADVFTDTTLVKVELNGRKTTFSMSASSTRQDVVEEVADRFPELTEEEIDAVLDFEVEDRASRTNDRDEDEDEDDDDDSSGRGGEDDDDDDDSSSARGEGRTSLEVEAKVRDGRAEIEVELNDVKTKFTVSASTRSAVVDAVASRFPVLSKSQIDAVLEFEVKD